MSLATAKQLTQPTEGISCHAFNGDGTKLAICPNNNEIHIYEGCDTNNWVRTHVLAQHDLVVSGLDWSPVTNLIVSCSHDRNGYVWTWDEAQGKWQHAAVILRIDRGALDVQWAADGTRFAVASASKCVPVCTYDASSDWWVSKTISSKKGKKHFKSTVLCVAFHPQNSQILACGSSDFKCNIFSVFSSDVDAAPDGGPFGAPVEFGDTYADFTSFGWVNAVAWSPSGAVLAFAGHDSSVHFVTFGDSGPVCRTTRFKELPLCSLYFPSDSLMVGGGHEFNPVAFTGGSAVGSEWTSIGFLDRKKAEDAKASTSGCLLCRALFQNKSTRGQETQAEGDVLWTKHESCIRTLTKMGGPSKMASSGLDGRVVVWDLAQADVGVSMASLGIR
ncbi:unnamed protein product [Ectocarpus fasciculatus]